VLKQKMLYPDYLKSERLFSEILESESQEIDLFSQLVDVFSKELTPSLSDEWLGDWEELLGLPILTNTSAEIRQSNIVSLLRSSGTLTSKRLKEIAISYQNGEIEVKEDTVNHKFTISFIGKKGVPPNYDAFKLAVGKAKPAHLNVEYEFSYNTRNYLTQFKREDLSKLIINDIREKNINDLLNNL